MIIKEREWISESAQEAILIIGDDNFQCAAFSQPCTVELGDSLAEPLLAMSVKGARKESDARLAISRQGTSFSHDIVAKVTNTERRIVSVGLIIIELDEPLPNDVGPEDVIQFTCGRLDVIA